jgi:hypothetical protein
VCGNEDDGLGFEHENMRFFLKAFTGLAPTRDILLEEVSGPHSFEIVNLIY